MSCGLGAIILVFMLVKYNVAVKPAPIENKSLETELQELQARESALSRQVTAADAARTKAAGDVAALSARIAKIQADVSGKQNLSQQQQSELSAIEKQIAAMQAAQTADVVENENAGEENYIIGLKVEGSRIAILIDSSASMTDEILIDVIRRKNRSDVEKRAGPKWRRAMRIVEWLLARVPPDSEVALIAFDQTARKLGPSDWVSGRDAQALGVMRSAMTSLVPGGPTNLQAGLRELDEINPSNVYLITDGLPTKGLSNFANLNPFARCGSLRGSSTTISGECRLKLLRHSILKEFPTTGVPVNVVLLPIEGDPAAAGAYWSWTSATGGLLISPAESWP